MKLAHKSCQLPFVHRARDCSWLLLYAGCRAESQRCEPLTSLRMRSRLRYTRPTSWSSPYAAQPAVVTEREVWPISMYPNSASSEASGQPRMNQERCCNIPDRRAAACIRVGDNDSNVAHPAWTHSGIHLPPDMMIIWPETLAHFCSVQWTRHCNGIVRRTSCSSSSHQKGHEVVSELRFCQPRESQAISELESSREFEWSSSIMISKLGSNL